jgi:hypothetical protein
VTTYRIEFDPNGNLFDIPELTLDFTNRALFAKAVTKHAIPHLTPALASMGRPELADCVFHPVSDMSGGHFLWLDFQSGQGARFCPARLTALPATGPAPYCTGDRCADCTPDDECCEATCGCCPRVDEHDHCRLAPGSEEDSKYCDQHGEGCLLPRSPEAELKYELLRRA